MLSRRMLLAPIAAIGLALATTPAALGQAPESDDVKTGLRIINQVVGHTGRLITSKNYDTVSHEHHEVVEGAEILRDGLADAPQQFQDEVSARLDDAIAASAAMAEPAAAHDDVALAAAHADFADAVHAVLDLFPEDVQPEHRNMAVEPPQT